jgi:hypothetical protein
MNNTFKYGLIHDCGFSGNLAGKHIEMAYAEIEAEGILRDFQASWATRSDKPEEAAAHYFASRFANPRGEEFAITKPLPPADPVPNKCKSERLRTELMRQYHHLAAARGSNFIPCQLAGWKSWRAEIRCLQLANHPDVLAKYRETLGLDR